jgi:hypothetical protein
VTWLSFCARRPGPGWKQGYGTGDRTLAQIEGVVDHSMEGSQAGAYSVLDGPAQSSWTFSLPKFSEPVQHYRLEKITWHAGLPGDRRHDTSLIGNLTLVGKEHEGKAGEPWTENQVYWSAKIDVALRELCPAFGANPPTLRKNMWEHRWLSATSCPSGRNPWHAKFALINEWELEPIEEDDMKKLQPVKDSGTTVYVTNFINKWPLTAWALLEEMWQKDIAERSILTLSDKLLASIPSAGRRKAVALGTTAAEVADELARRLAG